MIKKYDDFNNDLHLSKEREAMERELTTRKTMRDNLKYDLEINLDLLKREILYSIDNGQEYILNVGRRKENLEGSEEYIQHIEFENDKLGRFRIFKPKDNKDIGHYEINNSFYETNIKEIRDFYHILKYKIEN